MQKTHANMFLILVSTVAFIAMAITPALAKDSEKKKSTHSSVKTAGHALHQIDGPKASHDKKPGPAWMTFGGTVKKIEGNTYTVEDYEGNHVSLYVGQGTKQIKPKKVGTLSAQKLRRAASQIPFSSPYSIGAHTSCAMQSMNGPALNRPAHSLCATAGNRVIGTPPSLMSETQCHRSTLWRAPSYCPYRS